MANTVIVNPEFLINGSPIIDNQTELQNSISENTFLNSDSQVDLYVFSNGLLNYQTDITTYRVGRNENNEFVADLNVDEDLQNLNITTPGEYNLVYQFNQLVAGTSQTNLLRVDEISPSRTEIGLTITNNLNETIDNIGAFIDYFNISDIQVLIYLNANDGRLFECTNIQLDIDDPLNPRVFIKLESPLLDEFSIDSTFYIVQPITSPVSYTVLIQPEEVVIDEIIDLGRPNTTSATINYQNPGTRLLSLSQILSNPTQSSRNEIENFLSQSGLSLNIDHNNYEDFVFYSSAERRLQNFYEKVVDIENYSSSLARLSNTPGGATTRENLQNNINNIIRGFTFYENFLYYTSGSNAWPKINTKPPFLLQTTGSIEVLEWYGSTNTRNQYYGGQILSASDYDALNKNSLFYNIPQYLRDDEQNDQYKVFVDMIGEHFDEIWLYTKDITNKFDGDNRIDYGISKDLVSEAIKDFSLKLYQNNFSSKDIYNAFLGINESGSYYPFNNITTTLPAQEGDVYINNLVTSSDVPTPVDDINKRIYKRIYHNTPYLLRSKGNLSNIRTLLNIYGIPRSILDIYQYGGKDRVNTNDWDLYKEIYNKEISTGLFSDLNYIQGDLYTLSNYNLAEYNSSTSSTTPPTTPTFDGVIIPKGWTLNDAWNINPSIPRTIEFRFKSVLNPDNLSFQPDIKQVLLHKGERSSNNILNTEVAISLEYNGSGSYTGSYSGSIADPNNKNANLVFYISGSSQYYTASINDLPLLNRDWWSVMLQYTSESNNFNLYCSNKIYKGDDGTTIGYFKSSSITLPTYNDTLGYRSSNNVTFNAYNTCSFNNIILQKFSGSFQEIRYWTNVLDEEKWKNHVMNPLSIEGNQTTGPDSSTETLAFRTREGEDYNVDVNDIISNNIESIHPKVTGSFIPTASFPTTIFTTGSDSHYIILSGSFLNNNETQFLNQPIIGIKNRISDKIRIEDAVVPSQNMLSAYNSFIQDPLISQSYSPNLNYVEIGFSPANQINDDIINSLGGFDIGEYIGDPRLRSSSALSYPDLDQLRNEYFEKYFKSYNVSDFIRLIDNFDNSLFKMIKDSTPLRSNTNTGIIIKQSLLERQKYPEPKLNPTTTIAKKPSLVANADLTGSFSLGLNGNFSTPNGISTLLLVNDLSSSIGSKTYDGIVSEIDTTLGLTNTSGSIFSKHATVGIDLNIGNLTSAGPESNTSFFISSNLSDPNGTYIKYDINNNPIVAGSTYGTNLENLSTNFTLSIQPNEIITAFIDTQNEFFDAITITGSVFESTEIENNVDIKFKDISLTGSVKSSAKGFTTGSSIEAVSGSTGGLFNIFNSTNPLPNVTQSKTIIANSLSGSIEVIKTSQDEFYNGEFSGSHIILTTQSLNPHCDKYKNVFIGTDDTFDIQKYDVYIYGGINTTTSSLSSFTNSNTVPGDGELYIFNSGRSGSAATSGLNNSRIEKIKVSTTDKDGNFNYDVLRQATRLNFRLPTTTNIGTFEQRVNRNVTIDEITTNHITFTPTFERIFDSFGDPLFLNNSNYENINVSASGASGSRTHIDCVPGGVTTHRLPLQDFSDNQGTNNISTTFGVYVLPYTPNQIFELSASVDVNVSSSATLFTQATALVAFNNNVAFASSNVHFFSGTLAGMNENTTLKFSHSFNPDVPVNGDAIQLKVFHTVDGSYLTGSGIPTFRSGTFTVTNGSFEIVTQSFYDNDATGSINEVYPFLPVTNNLGFENDLDCQPLLINYLETKTYKKYHEIENTYDLIKPNNFSAILNNDAPKAETPESNYSQKSSTILKYEGSKLSGLKINQYTPPSSPELTITLNGEEYKGDISYGATPVINVFKTYFGYFYSLLPTSPELENHTQVKLRYLIDGTGTVFKPVLDTPTYFNVIDNYETGDVVSIQLGNSLQQNDPSLVNAAVGTNLDNFNVSANVLRGGQRIDPILTNQVYSKLDNDPESFYQIEDDGTQTGTNLTKGLFRRVNAFSDVLLFDSPEGIETDHTTRVFISKNLNGGTDPATEGPRVNIGAVNYNDQVSPASFLGVTTQSYAGTTTTELDPESQYDEVNNKIVFATAPQTRIKFKFKGFVELGIHAYQSPLERLLVSQSIDFTGGFGAQIVNNYSTEIIPAIPPVLIALSIYRRRGTTINNLANVFLQGRNPQGEGNSLPDGTFNTFLGDTTTYPLVSDDRILGDDGPHDDFASNPYYNYSKIIGIGNFVDTTTNNPANQTINEQKSMLETSYIDIQAGDEVFYGFRYITPSLNQFDNIDYDAGFGVDLDPEIIRRTFKPMNLSFVTFEAVPEFLPTETLTASFWLTGSNRSFITSSVPLTRYYDTVRQFQTQSLFQLNNGGPTTFKPINETFTVRRGDQFRFEGLESNVYTVKSVDEASANTGSLGQVVVELDRPLEAGIDTDKFLLRRFNNDADSVIIDAIPPASSYPTTNGIITHDFETNITNIDEIMDNLVNQGIITE